MIEKILNILRKLVPRRIFRFFSPTYHYILALTGNLIYRFPGRKLICIGITGTNGKSTTAELVNSILKEADFKAGMLSTVAIEIAGKRSDNITNRTTLGRWQTSKMLRAMVKAGCRYAVIEVASEGIVQYRTWGIPFDVAVFTNLSPEHLNTHKTMKRYREAKGKLFANLSLSKRKKFNKVKIAKVNIYNADDKEAGYFGSFPADKVYGFGFRRGEVKIINLIENDGLQFNIENLGKKYPVGSKLKGRFNAENIAAAFCVGLSQEIDPKKIAEGIKKIEMVKGRMEKVTEKKGIQYFIDYAVTPDSFALLLAELRKLTKENLIIIFGATGDRDKSKRPLLGEAAAKGADILIITDEEPYSENPGKIIDEIIAGAKRLRKTGIYKEIDRKKAIIKAIAIAKPGDLVVATGMGHQKYRNVGGNKKIEWDEAEIIKKLLK